MKQGLLSLLTAGWSFTDEHGAPRGSRLRRIAITMLCAALGIVGGLFILLAYSGRRPPPAMSTTDFERAQLRWEQRGPKGYVMDVQLFGRQSGEMTIGVFDDRPIHVSRNGTITPEHTWQHWTIDGLFEIIRRDLEGLDEPARAFEIARDGDAADRGQPPVTIQQAEFDTQLGYPRRYRRAVQNTGEEIGWEIVRFEVRE